MNPTPPVPSSVTLRLTGVVLYFGLIALFLVWSISLVMLPGPAARWLEWPLVIALLGLPVAACWPRFRLFRTWRSAGVGAALFVALLVWLAWDDPKLTTPLTLDELSPAPASQVDESYQVTLAYTSRGDRAAPRPLPAGSLNFQSSPAEKFPAWQAEVVKNREKVEAEWVALAPVRDWQAELDRYAAIGDVRSAQFDAPFISLPALRRLGDATCAKATLLALDGKGDAACGLLRSFLSVQCKLQRHARSEARLLAAQRGIGRSLATAQFVLATTPVSPSEKTAFATVLTGNDPAAFARRLAWLPYVTMSDLLITQPHLAFAAIANEAGARSDVVVSLLSWLRPVTVLPRATANILARFSAAAEKQILDPSADTIASDGASALRELSSASPKNIGGRTLVLIAVPNYHRIGESLRKSEAIRHELLAILAK